MPKLHALHTLVSISLVTALIACGGGDAADDDSAQSGVPGASSGGKAGGTSAAGGSTGTAGTSTGQGGVTGGAGKGGATGAAGKGGASGAGGKGDGQAGAGGKAAGGGGSTGAAGKGGAQQGGAAGDTAQGGAAGDTAQGGAAGDTAQGGAAGDTGQGGAAGDTAQGGAAGDAGQGGAAGDTAQGGAAGDTGQGGAAGDTSQGGAAGDTGQGGAAGDTGQGGAAGDTGQGGAAGDTGQGGAAGDTGQGGAAAGGDAGAAGAAGDGGAGGAASGCVPACDAGTYCSANLTCINVGTCGVDADCPIDQFCSSGGVCITNGTCLATADCAQGTFCSAAAVCINDGTCLDNADCQPTESCDTATNTCVFGGCGAVEVVADVVAPNILFVVDRSCSMTAKVGTKTKWAIAVDAMTTMTTSYAGKINWGLILFPDTVTPSCSQTEFPVHVAPGTEPTIKTLLAASLSTTNKWYPDGPCVTNIDTGMQQAQLAEPALNDTTRKSYVVLITDGQQAGCSAAGGDAGTTAIIKDLRNNRGVSTFVIGFGSGVDANQMNAWATDGGVPNSDPANPNLKYYKAEDQASFDSVLATIAKKTLGCVYNLQQPPPDPSKVYVFFDNVTQVAQDPTHSEGWDYDAAANRVEFYGQACTQLKDGIVQDLDIVFGCPKPIQ